MARNLGTFTFAANFQVKAAEALDPRVVVDSKAELISQDTWPSDGDTLYLYNGLIVGVVDTKEVYMLVDKENALADDYSGWQLVSGVTIEVVDNLTTADASKALSANQGVQLLSKITTLEGKLTSIYTYKDSVAFADLPTENLTAGDVYNVTDEFELDGSAYPAGTNVAWTGSAWDALGGSIDLSAYYTAEQVDAAILVETERAQGEEAALLARIETAEGTLTEVKALAETNEANIGTISGQIGTINEEIAQLQELVGGTDEDGTSILELVNQNAAAITALEERVTAIDDAESGTVALLTARVSTLETSAGELQDAVDILNGDAGTEGSVQAQIAEALAWVYVE